MLDGKKESCINIVYEAFDSSLKQPRPEEGPSLKCFFKALDNVKPMVEVKSRRVGG